MEQFPDRPQSKRICGHSLSNPESCGEDLEENLNRTIAMAPSHCAGCADYHIANATVRLLDNAPWRRGAGKALLEALQPIFTRLKAGNTNPIDVVAAACADTAVLSACAHAAWIEDPQMLKRIRHTVIDRCPTPLALCEEFAARHDLQIRTNRVDLSNTERTFPADLIVLHNLLPFIPQDRHVGMLRQLGSWLKSGGRMVLWQLVIPPEDRDGDVLTRIKRVADMKAMVESGRITISETKETFFARLDRYADDNRPGQPRSPDTAALRSLIASAGLEISSIEEFPHNCPHRSKLYVMIVAGRPSIASGD